MKFCNNCKYGIHFSGTKVIKSEDGKTINIMQSKNGLFCVNDKPKTINMSFDAPQEMLCSEWEAGNNESKED